MPAARSGAGVTFFPSVFLFQKFAIELVIAENTGAPIFLAISWRNEPSSFCSEKGRCFEFDETEDRGKSFGYGAGRCRQTRL